MHLGDVVTFTTLKPISFLSSILEHISSSFVRTREVILIKDGAKEMKTRVENVCVRLDTTSFCKHLLRLGPTPPPTCMNIKQLHDVVEKPNLVWETGGNLFNA